MSKNDFSAAAGVERPPRTWPRPDAFTAGPFVAHLGVRRIGVDRWIDLDIDYDDQVELKQKLYEERQHDVVVRIADEPSSAEHELCDLVIDAVLQKAPDQRQRIDALERNVGHGIHLAGMASQEDWVLLDGELRVTAASVSFPTRWLLSTKLGIDVTAVHQPVTEYDDSIAVRANRFMDRIEADQCWTRNNWNLVDETALFQPRASFRGPGPNPAVNATNAGETLILRVERETFRRMPATRALAFGIRVHTMPIGELRHSPERLSTLRSAVRALPTDTARYKGLAAFNEAFEQWCSTVIGD